MKKVLILGAGFAGCDLPPKKWTQRRVGVSIKAGS
jgi:NADH dehydrogenase FAD-containing subunit